MFKEAPQLPLKMVTDTGYEHQPENTYSFALNAVNNAESGNRGSLVNEQSNYDYLDLPGNYCGHITINRYKSVVFTDDGSITLVNTEQVNPVTTLLVNLPEFNFKTAYPVTGEYRLVRGCEDVIYWRDGINPDRYFNYSNPEDFQVGGVFDINQFNFNKDYSHPVISTNVVDSGGDTFYGSYFFCIEYVDNRGNVLFTSPLSIKYTVIGGGYNIDNYSPEVGGMPKSNSSIEVTIENLSTDYEFIRINTVIYRSGNGVTLFGHATGRLFPITSSTLRFVYTGYNPDAGDYEIDVNSLLIEKNIYASSMVMEQVDGRLLRANLIESYKDYSNYQKYSSMICTNYIVDKCELGDLTEIGGEVKAYGIVYVFRDGTTSPVFHIPGPRHTGDYLDMGLKKLVLKAQSPRLCKEDINYDITYTIDGVEYNETGSFQREVILTGALGDIQVISLNTQTNCDNVIVTYAIEFLRAGELDGISLSGQNYLPDWKRFSTAERLTTTPQITGSMGYYYSNELYTNPANFCGNEFWGTDCGGESLIDTPIRYHHLPTRVTEPIADDVTVSGRDYNKIGVKFSNIIYPDDNIVGHYFVSNIRTPFNSTVVDKGLFFMFPSSNDDNNSRGRIIESTTGSSTWGFISPESTFMSKYVSGDYLTLENFLSIDNPVIKTNDDEDFFKQSDLNFQVLRLNLRYHNITEYLPGFDTFANINKTYIVKPKTVVKDNSTLGDISNKSLSSTFILFRPEPFSVAIDGYLLFYGSLKRNIDPFPNLKSITYRRITELNDNTSFHGDGFISRFDITNISGFSADNTFNIPILQKNKDRISYEFEYIKNLVVESTVNTMYRHIGTTDCNNHYQGDSLPEKLFDWIIPKVIDFNDGKAFPKARVCAEWYGYNKDMSVINTLNRYSDLPLLWDYCSACTNLYPTRIIFSQKSLAEQLEDNYLLNLTNDYVDLPGDTGEILGMDYKDGKILVRTTYAAYILQPNAQQLTTNEATVYIGTGEFLSIPAIELNAEQTGYGGQQHILESINTEHGLIWVDRQKGKVFKFASGLEEISRFGMQYWFMNNLPGDGHCVLGYDPQYERVLISKQGSWTISYDMLNKSWTSFHSYIPHGYIYDGSTFYSAIASKLYKHKGAKTFANFMGNQYDYIIEFVIKDYYNFDLHSIQFYANGFVYNNGEWIKDNNITFTGMWAYNSFQSTGYVNLELDRGYDNVYYYPDKKHVKISDETHKINNIKAGNTQNSISIGDYPNKQPVPINPASQYDLVPLSSKYAVVRLYMNNGNAKLITNMVNTLKKYNIR